MHLSAAVLGPLLEMKIGAATAPTTSASSGHPPDASGTSRRLAASAQSPAPAEGPWSRL